MIYIFSSYEAALYIRCWSCKHYEAARAAPAVWLSPPMIDSDTVILASYYYYYY